MEYKFTIPRIPGMNEYTDANRAHYGKGGRMTLRELFKDLETG